MKIQRKTVDFIINVLSLVLMILSLIIFLFIIAFYQLHSPDEYVTHDQFYMTIVGIGLAFFAGLLSIQISLSNKLTDFAGDLGELKGKLDQYIGNNSVKQKKK